jgi:hypothetical protein
MDTYTIIFSVGGILALVGFVALITFFEDLKKWVKHFFHRGKKKQAGNTFDPQKAHNINYMFQDAEDALMRKHDMKMKNMAKH